MQRILIMSEMGGWYFPDEFAEALHKSNKDLEFVAAVEQSNDPITFNKYRIGDFYSKRRDDPLLLQCFEDYIRAGGDGEGLAVVEIPDGIEWEICEYDGGEWVAEKHRKWDETGEISL